MTEEELKIARQLGEQVHEACSDYVGSYVNGKEHNHRDQIKPLLCPNCTNQPLSSMGDEREILFCPHCHLTVELKVTLTSK